MALNSPQQRADDEYLARLRLGQLLLLYLVVWIGEGAARKWVAPTLQEPLYFLRIPVVLAIVYFSLKLRRPALPVVMAAAALAIAALVAFSGFHVIAGDQSVVSAVLGIRLYVEAWLVPLCVASALDWAQVRRVVRFVVLTVPPMTVLALVQATSPATSPVNRLFEADASDVFRTIPDAVRPSGTFTSSLGFSSYVILAVACVLALAIDAPVVKEKLLLLVAAPSVGVMVLVSGSRSALLGSAAPLLFVLVVQAVRRPGASFRLGAGVAIAGLLAYRFAPIIAPTAVEGLRQRTEEADESIPERILGDFTSWADVLPQAPPSGQGLGASTGGLANLGARVDVEGELVRWVLELGQPLFFLALALRLAICASLLVVAVRVARRAGRVTPLIVLIGALPLLLTGSVTGQGTINGFAALAGALVLAWRPEERALPTGLVQRAGATAL